MKICSKCKVEKEESEFVRNRNQCKKCRNEQSRKWVAANPEKRKLILKSWNDKNKKYKADWYKQNKNEICETYRAKYATDKDHIKQRNYKYVRQVRENLDDVYLKDQLKRRGYSKEEIESIPTLLPVEKISIITKRFKKLQNKKS